MKTILLLLISITSFSQSAFVIAPSHTAGSAQTITNSSANDASVIDTFSTIIVSGRITFDYSHKTVLLFPLLFSTDTGFVHGTQINYSDYNVQQITSSYSPSIWPGTLVAAQDSIEQLYIRAGYIVKSIIP